MIEKAIHSLFAGNDLSRSATRGVMHQIMEGEAKPSQIGAFLAAMRMKGETIDEITACAEIMRDKCIKIRPETDVLDIVGTGGDELFSFNISTVSAFVVAAAGVPVAKHGGRSVSSQCGSADLLEALGVNINLTAAQSKQVLDKTGMCFMHAQVYHTAMKHVAPIRKELGARTIFNILGPLANPAGAAYQLLGVYDENLVEPLARVLLNLGVKRAMVVHGHDGLDEVSLTGSSTICEVYGAGLNSYFISPEQFGLKRCAPEDLKGGDAAENAEIATAILRGETGPKRDIVLLNAACCIYMSKNNVTMRECLRIAEQTIHSGAAHKKLDQFIKASAEVVT